MMQEFKPPGDDAHEDKETALRTAGQRSTSLLWEVIQGLMAVGTVWGVVIMSILAITIPTELSSLAYLIVGFYFGRTNHTAVGGVGPRHHAGQRR